MVAIVVVINTLISLLLLYVAWRVWKLKEKIRQIADKLTAYEHSTQAKLAPAPEKIYPSQQNIHNLRQKNQKLKLKIRQIQQIVSLMLLGRNIWRRQHGRNK
jgi:predicted PurR-regulated permease PerM